MAKFWWGQKENEKKIHWKSWLKLSVNKLDGGMGFKDLEMFNNALLAKQVWRMLQEPDSLWVRVLKGVHFPNSTVLDARKGARASWIWNSLLVGRDFLKSEILWQIGDGECVNIWNDRWIPGFQDDLKGFPGPVDEELPIRVSELINPDVRSWDLSVLEEWLTEDQQLAISKIPLSFCSKADRLVWPHTTDGKYSVKSGYTELSKKRNIHADVASSSHHIDKKVWHEIWGLDVPNKIKIFLWRACWNILPTKDNLCKKKCV